MNLKFFILLLFSALIFSAESVLALQRVSGLDLVSGEKFALEVNSVPEKSALVIVFLSSKCPSSLNHLPILSELQSVYPGFKFIGVHSNADESSIETRDFFQKAKLSFPVLEDGDSILADELKAFKTPHVFVLNSKGKILYKGGVTDSHQVASARQMFLSEALAQLSKGQEVLVKEGRTLGCVIQRKRGPHVL